MAGFSAAMEGWRIQSCRRLTDSSWRFSISARMASRSLGCACAQRGMASNPAAAAAPCRKARRSVGGKASAKGASLAGVALFSSARFFDCSSLLFSKGEELAITASYCALRGMKNDSLCRLVNAGEYTFWLQWAMGEAVGGGLLCLWAVA